MEIVTFTASCQWNARRGWGTGVCNFSHFPAISPQFRNCLLLDHLAWLSVPCVSPVQKCCSSGLQEVWLWHRNFPVLSLHFSAIFAVGFEAP